MWWSFAGRVSAGLLSDMCWALIDCFTLNEKRRKKTTKKKKKIPFIGHFSWRLTALAGADNQGMQESHYIFPQKRNLLDLYFHSRSFGTRCTHYRNPPLQRTLHSVLLAASVYYSCTASGFCIRLVVVNKLESFLLAPFSLKQSHVEIPAWGHEWWTNQTRTLEPQIK